MTTTSVRQAKNGENLKKGESTMPSFCGYGLCSESTELKKEESAIDARTVRLIFQIVRSLPDMSPEVMDFWINDGSELPELKNILAVLSSPKAVSGARKSSQARIECEYGELNS